jgi:NADH-quinone oxidoreductase subunit J
MELAVFLVFALLAVLSALVVVFHRNPVYSVMSLVVTFVSVAALFVLLGAPFLAALQVLVYTGAILVLFLFVIMLLNVGREEADSGASLQRVVAVIGAILFGGLLLLLLSGRYAGHVLAELTPEAIALKPLARELLSTYLLPFEIAGLLLLAAVVAATALASRSADGEDR